MIGRHWHRWRRFLRRDKTGGFVKCDKCGKIEFLSPRLITKFNKLWNRGHMGRIRLEKP